MRKVIFTESQLKHILGENFDCYLPDVGEPDSPEYDENEISLVDFNDNIDIDIDEPDADRIVNKLSSRRSWLVRGGAPKATVAGNCTMAPICETNRDLVNHSFNAFSQQKKSKLGQIAQNTGSKLLKNMSQEDGASEGTMAKRKHDLKVLKKTDKIRYNAIGGKKIVKAIETSLNAQRNASKATKDAKKAAGDNNVYQKPEGTRNNGGKAHSEKPNITYEN